MDAQIGNAARARVTRRTLLKRAGAGGIALLAAPLIGGLVAAAPAGEEQETRIGGPFQMRIYEGPSAGAEIKGTLVVPVSKMPETRGEIRETVLVTDDFKILTVTGRVTGQLVSLAFKQQDGGTVLGNGSMQFSVDMNQGMSGGVSVGPKAADYGTWQWQMGASDRQG